MKTKAFTAGIILFFGTANLSAQVDGYHYRQEISEITDSWHQLFLPNQLFSAVQPDLRDIRVIGVNMGKDTIEAPYLIKKQADQLHSSDIPFRLINQVKSGDRYFSTFVPRKKNPINEILLDLNEENYNLSIRLEGSNNQYNWFEILDDYRIVGIKNDFVNYSFSKLIFPDSQYKFYRVSWESAPNIRLLSASLKQNETIKGKSALYNSHYTVKEDSRAKLTIVDITLNEIMPVSKITVEIASSYDFYRPIAFQKIIDSIKINDDWQAYYSDVYSNVLSSLEAPVYRIPEIITNKLRLLIYNHDNEPVTIKNIFVEGDVYKLVARFTEDAQYYLYYGNSFATKPNYDIKYFGDNIPENLKSLSTGEVENLIEAESAISAKKIKKVWLWGVMGLIVVILGGFTIHMIRNSNNE